MSIFTHASILNISRIRHQMTTLSFDGVLIRKFSVTQGVAKLKIYLGERMK